jgi:hypothetical protein
VTETARTTPPPAGAHRDVPNDVYRSWEAASCSTLQTIFNRSPKHARHAELTPKTPTPALLEGTAIHTMILEPQRFSEHYAIAQQCTATKKSGDRCGNAAVCLVEGEWVCGVHAKGKRTEQGGKELVPQPDYDRWRAIADAVASHPTAGRLVKAIEDVELSLLWADKSTACPCKARIDGVAPKLGTLVDIKTTEDAGHDFAKSVHRFGYYRQAAWYLAGAAAVGIEAEAFAFVAVEKQLPHDVAVYQCPDELLQLGWAEMEAVIDQYQACLAGDVWPGHADDPIWLTLPDWRLRQLEREGYAAA